MDIAVHYADPGEMYYAPGRMDAMPTDISRKLFTVEEYHQMAEAGIFHNSDRTELIDGEIILMTPIGVRHAACVMRTATLFVEAFGRRGAVSPQNPVQLNDWTEPQPDVVVLKPRPDFYAGRRPRPDDALLVVEVADSSLRFDKTVKLPHFAIAGIPEVWVEDLQNEAVLVYRDPVGNTYTTNMTLHAGDSIAPLAFPECLFRVDDLMG